MVCYLILFIMECACAVAVVAMAVLSNTDKLQKSHIRVGYGLNLVNTQNAGNEGLNTIRV